MERDLEGYIRWMEEAGETIDQCLSTTCIVDLWLNQYFLWVFQRRGVYKGVPDAFKLKLFFKINLKRAEFLN